MSTKSSVWDKILKVIIAVASALIGALSAHAMTVSVSYTHLTLPTT